MDIEDLCAKTPTDRFTWQYSFYAYLVYRSAPAPEGQLADLAQIVHSMKGHMDPIEAADEVMSSWPFDLTK